MKYLIILMFLANCGLKLKHEGEPTVKVSPDFEGAAKFCDERYGEKTEEAEACFKDYREYTNIKVSLDLEVIEEFCAKNYDIPQERIGCENDLIELLGGALK